MENYRPAKRVMFKIIELVMAKRNCTTINCSFGEHQETLKLTKRVIYINSGINTSELDKMLQEVERVNHPFTVFTLDRICYQKNPELFNAVTEAIPEVCFLWIGDGELREELRSKDIEITGWVDREKALRFSLNTDAFLLTSLWEGLPISLLESMHMKKLCVVNDVIGNHNVIHVGENGLVCCGVNDFLDSIHAAMEGNVEDFIATAYKDVEQIYNTKVMGREYSTFYMNKMRGCYYVVISSVKKLIELAFRAALL